MYKSQGKGEFNHFLLLLGI